MTNFPPMARVPGNCNSSPRLSEGNPNPPYASQRFTCGKSYTDPTFGSFPPCGGRLGWGDEYQERERTAQQPDRRRKASLAKAQAPSNRDGEVSRYPRCRGATHLTPHLNPPPQGGRKPALACAYLLTPTEMPEGPVIISRGAGRDESARQRHRRAAVAAAAAAEVPGAARPGDGDRAVVRRQRKCKVKN